MNAEQLAIRSIQDALGYLEQPEHIAQTHPLRRALKDALSFLREKHGFDDTRYFKPLPHPFQKTRHASPKNIMDVA